MYYRGADAAIVVYDITSTVSCLFNEILFLSPARAVYFDDGCPENNKNISPLK